MLRRICLFLMVVGMASAALAQDFHLHLPEPASLLAGSPNGDMIAMAAGRKTWVYSKTTKRRVSMPEAHGTITALAWSADSQLLAAGTNVIRSTRTGKFRPAGIEIKLANGFPLSERKKKQTVVIQVWNVTEKKTVTRKEFEYPSTEVNLPRIAPGNITKLGFFDSGVTLLATTANGLILQLKEDSLTVVAGRTLAHRKPVSSAVSTDGTALITSFRQGVSQNPLKPNGILAWDPTTTRLWKIMELKQHTPSAMMFVDKEHAVIAYHESDGAELYHLPTGTLRASYITSAAITKMTTSPDGRYLATFEADGKVRVRLIDGPKDSPIWEREVGPASTQVWLGNELAYTHGALIRFWKP